MPTTTSITTTYAGTAASGYIAAGALDLELTFEQKILELMGPRSEEVRLKALELKFMTYNSDLALKKLGRGAYKLSGPEMAALKTLLVKLSDLGYEY